MPLIHSQNAKQDIQTVFRRGSSVCQTESLDNHALWSQGFQCLFPSQRRTEADDFNDVSIWESWSPTARYHIDRPNAGSRPGVSPFYESSHQWYSGFRASMARSPSPMGCEDIFGVPVPFLTLEGHCRHQVFRWCFDGRPFSAHRSWSRPFSAKLSREPLRPIGLKPGENLVNTPSLTDREGLGAIQGGSLTVTVRFDGPVGSVCYLHPDQ